MTESEPLTPGQVADLAVGEVVSVKWSGGNGPWLYIVCQKHHGVIEVATAWEMAKLNRDNWMWRPLTFVGPEPPFTVVRMVEA